MRNSEKHGEAGAKHAKNISFRYGHGSRVAKLPPIQARTDFRTLSTYESGLLGGLLAAKLGFKFPGSDSLLEKYNEV